MSTWSLFSDGSSLTAALGRSCPSAIEVRRVSVVVPHNPMPGVCEPSSRSLLCHRSISTKPSPTKSSPCWKPALSLGVLPILGRSSAGHPKNLNTGKQYRGVNVFLLAFTAYAKGYGSSYWMTFNQAKERGGNVRKGEKSSMVVFWKQYETKDKQTGEPVKRSRAPLLQRVQCRAA